MKPLTEHQQNLRFWRASISEAEKGYERAVRNAFPIGARIHSGKSGRGIVAGKVLAHGYGDRIRFESETGKRYWITADHVVEARLNDNLR